MYERAHKGLKQCSGPDNDRTLCALGNIANCLVREGKLSEAENMMEKVLRGYEKTLGPDDYLTLFTTSNYAAILMQLNRLPEAKILFDKALRGMERTLGPDHEKTLGTSMHFGSCLQQQDDFVNAAVWNERAVIGFEKTLGPDHGMTLTAVETLSNVYYRHAMTQLKVKRGVNREILDKMQESIVLLERAFSGSKRSLGPNHPETLKYGRNLAIVQSEMKLMSGMSFPRR